VTETSLFLPDQRQDFLLALVTEQARPPVVARPAGAAGRPVI